MPEFRVGNMWSVHDGVNPFLFTANSTLNHKGDLVMGKGIARQVSFKFPILKEYFGAEVVRTCGEYGEYRVLLHKETMIAAFQVKRDWRKQAEPSLISHSIISLGTWAANRPDLTFNINYPGIGAGMLSAQEVAPLLAPLPGNVHVWRYKK